MTPRKPRARAGQAVTAQCEPSPIETPDAPSPLASSPPPRSGESRVTRAVRAAQDAARLENRPAFGFADAILKPLEARGARERAEKLLQPEGELLHGGGEVTQRPSPDGARRTADGFLVYTLEHPNMIGVEASEKRTSDLTHLDILAPGLDAAETAQAGNSLEKMLCHQMAAAHHAAMRLLGDAIGPNTFTRLPPVEQVRKVNAAARMMDVYQAGLVTLQRLRTGGRQEVVVQHVQVNEGGQAVVAGNIKTHKHRGVRRGEE